jgi:Zn-dependent metalloprotease
LSKDIVAHELTHGITDYTARLEYLGESGALNESYSDIFGVLVANIGQPDVKKWNSLIGEGLFGPNTALRDMKKPENFDQPSHMDKYKKLPKTENGDWGGVHTNSGIHNKAAYNMLTAKDNLGRYLLKPRDVAALFYLALTQNLSRTSRFGDSRRGVELAARSLFANKSNKQARFKAVAKAFDKVGIV